MDNAERVRSPETSDRSRKRCTRVRTPSPTSRWDHKRMLLSELKTLSGASNDEESQSLVVPQQDLRLKLAMKGRSKSLREDILAAASTVAPAHFQSLPGPSVVNIATEGFSIQELEELKKILKKKQKQMEGT